MRDQAAEWRTADQQIRHIRKTATIKSVEHVGSAPSGSSSSRDHGRTPPRKRRMMKLDDAGGLSKTRLGRLHDVMASHIEAGDMPGMVTLVSRRGEIHVDAIGSMAIDGAPMLRDTIFRITSMTNPVADAANDGFTGTAARRGRLLDLGLSGHR
jgi:Beta-lactamase